MLKFKKGKEKNIIKPDERFQSEGHGKMVKCYSLMFIACLLVDIIERCFVLPLPTHCDLASRSRSSTQA